MWKWIVRKVYSIESCHVRNLIIKLTTCLCLMTLDTTLTVAIRKWTPLSSAANSHSVTVLEIYILQCNKVYHQAYCTDIHVCCRMYFYVLLQWLSSSDQSCAYALVWIWLYSVPVPRRLRCNKPLDQSPFIRVAPCSMNLYKKYHLFGTSAFNVFTVHICFPIPAWCLYCHHTIWFPQIPAITQN